MLTFSGAQSDDPRVQEWIADHTGETGTLAAAWFRKIRQLGPDVKELVHDGLLTACIDEYPFAYAGAYKHHASVGFFYGAALADPARMLEGSGKLMRHVKLKPDSDIEHPALQALIVEAYADIQARLNELPCK